LVGVLIENRPAVDVLQQHDGPDTLHFVDPPYVHSTRVLRARGGYRHEMTDDAHAELLECLDGLEGMVVLSGYESDIYADRLKHWRRFATSSRISAARGTTLRTEVVWLNPCCEESLNATDRRPHQHEISLEAMCQQP
jgi:DNA adenine methylase